MATTDYWEALWKHHYRQRHGCSPRGFWQDVRSQIDFIDNCLTHATPQTDFRRLWILACDLEQEIRHFVHASSRWPFEETSSHVSELTLSRHYAETLSNIVNGSNLNRCSEVAANLASSNHGTQGVDELPSYGDTVYGAQRPRVEVSESSYADSTPRQNELNSSQPLVLEHFPRLDPPPYASGLPPDYWSQLSPSVRKQRRRQNGVTNSSSGSDQISYRVGSHVPLLDETREIATTFAVDPRTRHSSHGAQQLGIERQTSSSIPLWRPRFNTVTQIKSPNPSLDEFVRDAKGRRRSLGLVSPIRRPKILPKMGYPDLLNSRSEDPPNEADDDSISRSEKVVHMESDIDSGQGSNASRQGSVTSYKHRLPSSSSSSRRAHSLASSISSEFVTDPEYEACDDLSSGDETTYTGLKTNVIAQDDLLTPPWTPAFTQAAFIKYLDIGRHLLDEAIRTRLPPDIHRGPDNRFDMLSLEGDTSLSDYDEQPTSSSEEAHLRGGDSRNLANSTTYKELSIQLVFINSRGNEYFCEIDEEYLTDRFNLTSLNTEVQYYQYALDLITDMLDIEVDDDTREAIEKSARHLYGLVHARYIVTTRGLAKMSEKYKNSDFGKCPRVACEGQPLLPTGQHDNANMSAVKLYCARCEDLYNPKSSRHASVDGAYFGSSFHNMFFQVYPNLMPPKSQRRYEPKVFGFRVHAPAALARWQSARREELKDTVKKEGLETGFEEEEREDEMDESEEEEGNGQDGIDDMFEVTRPAF